MAIDGGNLRRPERTGNGARDRNASTPVEERNSANEERKYTKMANEADSIFAAGSELGINIGWVSGNGQTILRLQQDRNLVLYKDNSPAYQAPNAWNNGNIAIMQDDGNLVLYDVNNGPVWASNTAGNPGAFLSVQDDGNLVVRDQNNNPLWATNTGN
jgi:hypothetical protein